MGASKARSVMSTLNSAALGPHPHELRCWNVLFGWENLNFAYISGFDLACVDLVTGSHIRSRACGRPGHLLLLHMQPASALDCILVQLTHCTEYLRPELLKKGELNQKRTKSNIQSWHNYGDQVQDELDMMKDVYTGTILSRVLF